MEATPDCKVTTVSYTQIRLDLTKQMLSNKANAAIPHFKAFYRCRKKAIAHYNKQLIQTIKLACETSESTSTQIIFLDKNHFTAGSILAVSHLIDQKMSWGVPYSKIHLIPDITGEKIANFPLSYQFMASSMHFAT